MQQNDHKLYKKYIRFIKPWIMAERNELTDRFDINLLYESLKKCCEDSNALNMEHYIIGFKELYRFFMLLPSVFSFVASDIISKIDILEEYQHSQNSDHYCSIQSMIEYEKTSGVITDTSHPSGSRTLLRLHRALEFIMHFMRDISIADSDAQTSSIAQKCYNETLARYHPWLIKKAAYYAMFTLPARQKFLERVHGNPCEQETVEFYVQMMGNIADVSKTVYDETRQIYEENDLLDLP